MSRAETDSIGDQMTNDPADLVASRPRDGESPTIPPLGSPAPVVVPAFNLPTALPPPRVEPPSGRWRKIGVVLLVFAVAAGAGAYWWKQSQSQLPPGISWGNGRIEADAIDIETRFAGRIAELLADEGDMVAAGQSLARMDTRDLEASLRRAEAQARGAQKAIEEARANVVQQETQVLLARQEMDRANVLVQKGDITRQIFDQRQQRLDAANALLNAANARAIQAEHVLEAARSDAEVYAVHIADNTLTAPRAGRIQYRIANIGEVLPAGGKVFTMLDVSYVYADIFLPTADAGRIKAGTDARIVLDAYPDIPIPAKVTFIATQAQFTPKAVETRSERDKLMFRVRVRIDPERLRAHADAVKSGLPGVAYVRVDDKVAWPSALQGTAAR